MAQPDSLANAYQKIFDLMRREQWVDAHRACIEVLRFDPENIKVIRLKNKIEANVRKSNIKALKEDLKQLMPLYKARNFLVLMENLRQLEAYVNEYAPLKKFMLRVGKDYEQYQANEREKLYRQEIDNIKRIIKENNFQEAIRQAEKLRLLNLHFPEVKALLQSIKDQWINYELEQKRALIESEKYEDIIIFYQGLLRIDGKSEKIKRLIERDKKRAQMHKVEEKRDFIYASLEKIKTLFQLRKFESAMMASREILEIDPENSAARKYYERAKHKVKAIVEKEVIEQIKKSLIKNREDYKLNKKNYVRI